MLAIKTLEDKEKSEFYLLLLKKSRQFQIFNRKTATHEIK